MENTDINSLLIDYIDGNLPKKEHDRITNLIQTNADIKKEYDELFEVLSLIDENETSIPSSKLYENFQKVLTEELGSKTRIFSSRGLFYKIAASITFLAVISFFILNRIENDREIESLRSELTKTNNVLFELLKDNSTSARLTSANRLGEVKSIDKEIIDALWFTLNFDQNTNVRIAALNALSKFSDDPTVRKELVRALKFQDNPEVQITLINLLVGLKEKSIINQLNEIVNQDSIESSVKDEAQMGIYKLM